MLRIEFLKILKRKFNYIYILGSGIVIFAIHYLVNSMYTDIGGSKEVVFYNYALKLILSLVILFAILNISLSYRRDYSDGLAELIRYSKVSRFSNIFSKLIVNYGVSVVYYMILVIIYSLFNYYSIGIDKSYLMGTIMQNNIILSLVLLLYASVLALLIVIVFNSIYTAVPISILLLTSLTFVRELIKEKYNIQLTVDVFADSFAKISEQTNLEVSSLVQLSVYSACIFLISLIVKLIKNN